MTHQAGTAPFWRSLLYVPVTSRRFVQKAHTRGADAVQLDLEDSIPVAEKDEARRLLPAAIDEVAGHGVDVVVRVNRPWRLALRDLEAAVRPGVQALALPKVASADHVRVVDEIVSELEGPAGLAPGSVRLIAMVETADASFQMREIARSCPRVVALTLGSEDFAASTGIPPDPDLQLGANQQVVVAARAAGVLPLGLLGSIADYQDENAFREVVRRSRRTGLVGASAIHPRQVPLLNEGFSPSEAEVERATRLVAAFEQALEQGRGALEFDGAMVDEPIVERARAVLRLHEASGRR